MPIDVTGVELRPGNGGKDCPGNGEDPQIECCCDECDYMLDCIDMEKLFAGEQDHDAMKALWGIR